MNTSASTQLAADGSEASKPSSEFVRPLHPGMGQAVAERTVLRKLEDGSWESWGDVADRVALGNAVLAPADTMDRLKEYASLRRHIAGGGILMSGRHLQHGDENQPNRPMEVFTNCATAPATFLLFYNLLNGAGVGRCYDNDMMLVDWDNAPSLRVVLDHTHPDFNYSAHESVRDAKHKYGTGRDVLWFEVPDSREGWAKALETWEVAAFEKIHKDKLLILDFSKVREAGRPIKGMQNRPSSGPVPLMNAFQKAASIRGAGLDPWLQTMYIDHYFAECVLVGGARRAARMSTKKWDDKGILEFIRVKRPVEYAGRTVEEVSAWRQANSAAGKSTPSSFLWSSNNSIAVTEEFWRLAALEHGEEGYDSPPAAQARRVYAAAIEAGYGDGTGEPGFISVDRLTQNDEGWRGLERGDFVGSKIYQVEGETETYLGRLAKRAKQKPFHMITNPCVTGDTWISTDEGPRQVSELIGKPFKAVVNGKAYQAIGFWKTGDKKVFKVKTDRGYELRATDNHKLLVEIGRKPKFKRVDGKTQRHGLEVQTEWVEVKDLRPGDMLVLNNQGTSGFSWGDQGWERYEEGWLLGEIVGDGGYNPSKYPTYLRFWGEHKTKMSLAASQIVKRLPYDKHRPVQLGNGGAIGVNDTINVSSRVLDDLAVGLIEPGTKALLPELERKGSMFIRGFLRGFFDADGSVQGSTEKGISVRLGQSDLEKLRVVQRMLARLGIGSTIYENRREAHLQKLPDGRGGTALYECRAQHELVISRDDVDRFRIIGFSDPEKKAKLERALAYRKRPIYKDRFTAEIVSIEEDGFEAVYDCTVNDIHRFDANGIIAHNCGEIVLNIMGGFCVIADVVPYHAADLEGAEDSFRVTARALMRVNTMDSIYSREVRRTNRIGIGMTGIHEFAWRFFQVGFRDLINPDFAAYQYWTLEDDEVSYSAGVRAAHFWHTLLRFRTAAADEAKSYAKKLGLPMPHTAFTVKPAGTTSKLFGLTEGAHLPALQYMLRWVQFRNDDPLVAEYKAKGYPTRELQKYEGTTIVGFPTAPAISELGMGDALVLAGEATPDEQYRWLKLLEQFWIDGMTGDGLGNQVSYTLKYDPKKVDFDALAKTVLHSQPKVKAGTVMPQEEAVSYEYQPEQFLSKAEYEAICAAIKETMAEDVGFEHVDCGSGACPVDFREPA
jgi:intein/homing endonuclease